MPEGEPGYIAKPFRLAELLARIRVQLRVYDSSEDAIFQVGPYLFRPAAGTAHDPASGKPSPDGEGGGDPEIPVSRRRQACLARSC